MAALNSGLRNNSYFTFSLLKRPAVDMVDLLRRAERYVNAEEEMAARKQKTPWSGHQEERGKHSRNAPGKKEKKRTSGTSFSRGRAQPSEGHQSHPTTTSPPSWTHAPEYLPWSRIRSPSNGLRS
ncbi:hypothetical protein CFOL_v3_05219 [Cephalotus follicularis]|uniref:Uncharacterized protein n=1 Tax=Cephalotus follicularis TaxID=3775 RepID=A0A1Q3B1M8_CEPFO|nr:hypothetical protein CFOL_v3_05219 [Cephalotus follicularis]